MKYPAPQHCISGCLLSSYTTAVDKRGLQRGEEGLGGGERGGEGVCGVACIGERKGPCWGSIAAQLYRSQAAGMHRLSLPVANTAPLLLQVSQDGGQLSSQNPY